MTSGSKFLVVCYSRNMNELIMPWIKSIKALKQDRQKVQSFGNLDCEDMERKRYRRSRMIYWKELEHFDVWKDISRLRKEFKCNRWTAKLRCLLQLARWSKGRYFDKAYNRENEVKGSGLCLRIELYKMAVLWQLYTVFQNYCRVNCFIYCKFRRRKLILSWTTSCFNFRTFKKLELYLILFIFMYLSCLYVQLLEVLCIWVYTLNFLNISADLFNLSWRKYTFMCCT